MILPTPQFDLAVSYGSSQILGCKQNPMRTVLGVTITGQSNYFNLGHLGGVQGIES